MRETETRGHRNTRETVRHERSHCSYRNKREKIGQKRTEKKKYGEEKESFKTNRG